jgi:hypothetical protein
MAGLKVFISSTCYDLSLLRSELRSFILSLGYDPVMSDYADVVYDPRIHTHTSCIDEVANCDMLVVIIGSRLGGKSVPEALEKVDFASLENISKDSALLSKDTPVSITQLEVLKAISTGIPVYTFIDKKVYYEHEIYEKNKGNSAVIENIVFPAIEKPETAKYIFEFINFIRLKSIGNSIFQFERMQDIEDTLKKQWSGYFQRLLYEQRYRNAERKRIDMLNEQFEDLKTAILSSIENVDQRETARGIVRYRRLSDFLFALKIPQAYLCSSSDSFQELLGHQRIVKIIDSRDLGLTRDRAMMPRTFLLRDDGTFYESRIPTDVFFDFEGEWESFKVLQPKTKEIILDALHEMFRPSPLLRYHDEHIEDYAQNHFSSRTIEQNEE